MDLTSFYGGEFESNKSSFGNTCVNNGSNLLKQQVSVSGPEKVST